jgi:cytochrome c oxidase cbb3-type subunit III
MSQKYLLCASILLVLSLLQTQRSPTTDSLINGERLFKLHCAACHGPKGEGGSGPALAVPNLVQAPTEELLIRVIRRGIPGTEMPQSRLEDAQIGQVATWVRRLGQLPPERVPGDVQRGERLYLTKGACTQCHAIKGRGGATGPELTTIGLRRGSGYLRAALIEPEAAVPQSFSIYRSDASITENFLQVRIVTRDGRKITGVRVNEDTFSIQIRDLSDRIYSFFKSDLTELYKDWGKSPMPSYRDVFSKEEIDDVVAFMVSLRGDK